MTSLAITGTDGDAKKMPDRRASGGSSPRTRARAGAARATVRSARSHVEQRLLAGDPFGLEELELLEVLLGAVRPRRQQSDVAARLLSRFHCLGGVLAAPPSVLAKIEGVSAESVVLLKAIHLLGMTLMRAELKKGPVLARWDQLLAYLGTELGWERNEQFHVLYLDGGNRLLADELQGRGTVNHTPVYPREILKRALELHSTAIILVHNHPSGDPTPSPEDVRTTQQVRDAALPLGVVVHDHIIVGQGRWFSFRREGLW